MTDDTKQTLTEVQRIREQSRRLAHGGAWFPAFLLAALALASILLYRHPFDQPKNQTWQYPYWTGLPDVTHSYLGSFWLKLTRHGRKALRDQLDAMQKLVSRLRTETAED